jgi:CBS domain-containing protein
LGSWDRSDAGGYLGIIIDDIKTALRQREAIPFLLVGELMCKDPPVRITDDLATVLDAFSRHEVSHLPVVTEVNPTKVIGLVSGAGSMRRYYQSLSES